MMKLILLSMLMLSILLSGYKSENKVEVQKTGPDLEGYVTKKENQRALVVNFIPKDFSSMGGTKEFYNAVWVSKISESIEVGQKVQVWFKGQVLESYPAQAEARKVSILPSMKPDNANLSEDQVIRKALISKETANIKVFVIKVITFNEKLDAWTIQFKDAFNSDNNTEEHSLQILDK
jgi:hypothetical protein